VIGQLKAELLKVRSTRTTLGLFAGMVLLTVLIVVLTGLLTDASGLIAACLSPARSRRSSRRSPGCCW
jgi:hypothetical protein